MATNRKNYSSRSSLPYTTAVETPRHGRMYRRKFPISTRSVPVAGLYTPPLQAHMLPVPQMTDFYNESPQHNQDFHPFSTPSSYSKQPFLKRKSDPLPVNKRRRTSSPVPQRSLNVRNETPFLEMTDTMWQVYYNNMQTVEELNHKYALRSQLHGILRENFPSCGLYIVGSTMNGMGTKNCDMDLCLMLSPQCEIDQHKEAIKILQQVSKVLSQCSFIKNRDLIRAKVPILKFKDIVRGIDVDLNINNSVGIRNTRLLNSYSRIDRRVSPLVILIKLWARTYDINDAKISTLSSYSLALMIIHYLQFVCNPPVVPCLQQLQPGKYDPDSDVSKLSLEEDLPPFVSQNHQTLGELFYGFLNYYASVFDFSGSVISVRTGGLLPRDRAINWASPKNKRAHWKCVLIEEPFDLTNTARSVYDPSVFAYILSVFNRSLHVLEKTMKINSILQVSELLAHRT